MLKSTEADQISEGVSPVVGVVVLVAIAVILSMLIIFLWLTVLGRRMRQ